MFFVPAQPWLLLESPALLTWDAVQTKMPWGLLLLLGGGYAMADGAVVTLKFLFIGRVRKKVFYVFKRIQILKLLLLFVISVFQDP